MEFKGYIPGYGNVYSVPVEHSAECIADDKAREEEEWARRNSPEEREWKQSHIYLFAKLLRA